MSLLTTTIGAYPKPNYVPTPDWFRAQNLSLADPSKAYEEYLQAEADNLEALLDQGTHDAVLDQVKVGIDIPTDGEIRRENYIYYHCRHLEWL